MEVGGAFLNKIYRGVLNMFSGIFKPYLAEQNTTPTDDLKINEKRISDWLFSNERIEQITGDKYYKGLHDILFRERTAIGENGELTQINNLPNNKIIDNQYKKIVDQKTNYLVGQQVVFFSDNEKYQDELEQYFKYDFQILLKVVCADCFNCGLGWVYAYYDENGNFKLKRFAPYEILPVWADDERTELRLAIRLYDVKTYVNGEFKISHKVEIYKPDGIEYYNFINGRLLPDNTKESGAYFNINNKAYNWGRIPLIVFKYNYFTIPLIRDLKSLQDALNMSLSDWENNMQEDSRNSILILKNYDGANLGEFRQNLATYGAVKIREDGEVNLLKTEIETEQYKIFLETKKKEMISVAKAYDAIDLRSGNNPNELQIKSVLNDIDMDANGMEAEFKHSVENLLWFFKADLANRKIGDFFDEKTEIIFNKDQITNESQVILDIKNSVGIISNKTLLKNHPYVDDVEEEEKQIKQENNYQPENYFDNYSNKNNEDKKDSKKNGFARDGER